MPRPKLNLAHQVTAMLAAGASHIEIASALQCSTKTIQRIAKEVRPAVEEADSKLAALQREISSVVTLKQRAEKYANLALGAKNEAVSLGALQRIDDLDGILTDKERLRSKQAGDQQPAAMFIFPVGTSIDFGGVTINQAATTTNSASPISKDAETPKLHRISEGSEA